MKSRRGRWQRRSCWPRRTKSLLRNEFVWTLRCLLSNAISLHQIVQCQIFYSNPQIWKHFPRQNDDHLTSKSHQLQCIGGEMSKLKPLKFGAHVTISSKNAWSVSLALSNNNKTLSRWNEDCVTTDVRWDRGRQRLVVSQMKLEV